MKPIIPWGVALLGVACAPPPPDDPPPTKEPLYHSPQGRHMIGGNEQSLVVDTSKAVGADSLPFKAIEVRRAQLVGLRDADEHAGAGSILEGARLQGHTRNEDGQEEEEDSVQLQIVRICPHARPPLDWAPPEGWSGPEGCVVPDGWTDTFGEDEYDYEVRIRRTDGDPWSPLCDASWNRALPTAGKWAIPDAAHDETDARLTFACPDGVVAKCLNWGYKPWEHRDLHQACTRMARADYCANGESHTVEGATIGMTDRFRIRTDMAGLQPEASWTPDGEVRCLSKHRWRSLPPGGPHRCAETMKDPRIDDTARYCEEEPSFHDDLLINSSTALDVGLYLWTSSGDSFTTSHYFYDHPTKVKPPGPKYDKKAAFAGTAYRPGLDENALEGTVPLYSYVGADGDHLTTTQQPPPEGYELLELEGYIFHPDSKVHDLDGLHTWRHEVTGRHVTSGDEKEWGPPTCVELDAKGACKPDSEHDPKNGYVYVRLEGYMPTLNLR